MVYTAVGEIGVDYVQMRNFPLKHNACDVI